MTKEQKLLGALATALEVIDSKNELIKGLTTIAEKALKDLALAEFQLGKLREELN